MSLCGVTSATAWSLDFNVQVAYTLSVGNWRTVMADKISVGHSDGNFTVGEREIVQLELDFNPVVVIDSCNVVSFHDYKRVSVVRDLQRIDFSILDECSKKEAERMVIAFASTLPEW